MHKSQRFREELYYLYDLPLFLVPGGHPEGYLEALQNLYEFCFDLFVLQGEEPTAEMLDFPMKMVWGMAFIEVRTSKSDKNGLF
jgi:hypothetical protein